VAGLLAFALAGCGSDDEPQPAATQRPDANAGRVERTKPPQPKRLTSAQLKAAVGRTIIGEEDIGRDVQVQDQDTTLSAPTNDVCAKKWRGDRYRVARNQEFFWKTAEVATLVVSNEAVAYRHGKGASALAELRKAVDGCDGWEHSQGEMAEIEEIDPPDGAVDGAFAWQGTDLRSGGTDYSYVAVYQVKSDVLTAVYVWSTSASHAQEIAGELTRKAASRLESAVT
jgi:hypothetical protein